MDACRFESGKGDEVDVHLPRDMAVASRRELDSWLLRRAVDAGAVHFHERVVEVGEDGDLRTGEGRKERYEFVFGADGANSLVRRSFLSPLPKERRMMATGWFAPGSGPMAVRFTPRFEGYLWLFPRRDHVGVGICAPLGSAPTQDLLSHLEREVARSFPALSGFDCERYGHTIPSPSEDPGSILEIGKGRLALVGDAGGLADPITGEGIYFALRSAQILAQTLLETGSAGLYPERVLEDFGRDLLKAAALRKRFYAKGFAQRVVAWSARSASLRRILAELVMGEQGYLGLKRRLARTLPAFLLESALSPFRRRGAS
jgi:flavin-dependent dehydrogenase